MIKIRTTPFFFKIDLCSATSIESSRRDLLNDMAEHRLILKNEQNTFPFWFHIQNRYSIPRNGVFIFIMLYTVNRHNVMIGSVWDELKR